MGSERILPRRCRLRHGNADSDVTRHEMANNPEKTMPFVCPCVSNQSHQTQLDVWLVCVCVCFFLSFLFCVHECIGISGRFPMLYTIRGIVGGLATPRTMCSDRVGRAFVPRPCRRAGRRRWSWTTSCGDRMRAQASRRRRLPSASWCSRE
jgi:hypothetical protein